MVSEHECGFPIDLVYLWVDGHRPEFIKEKNYWKQKLNVAESEDTSDSRFIDNEELRYSLRSVAKNAPWINKIFIITNGQVPDWLDLSKADNIKIVKHDEIMPKEILPCYNSRVIESFVANIPDLSEHFLLANDDCFIDRPISPSFFFDTNGSPIVRFLMYRFTHKYLRNSLYGRSIIHTMNLFHKKYPDLVLEKYTPHHNIDAYTKSAYLECIETFKSEFDKLRPQKFREKSIQRIAFALYLLAAKNAKLEIVGKRLPIFSKAKSLYIAIQDPKQMIEKICSKRPYLLCINDGSSVEQEKREEFRYFLEFLYPHKQCWEKTETELDPKEIETHKKKYSLIKSKYFLKLLFSVTNICRKDDKHKVINILGVKIKFKVKKKADKNE